MRLAQRSANKSGIVRDLGIQLYVAEGGTGRPASQEAPEGELPEMNKIYNQLLVSV